jgi:hypothetical protein
MSSVIEICNMALGKAGITDTITNLDTEQSVEALWCKVNYPIARDSVLRDFPWRFATKTISLGALDEKRQDGKSVFLYPSDCLNIINVSNGGTQNFEIEIIGINDDMRKVIITDSEQAEVKYIARVTDPNLFDPLFVVALAWYIASDLALSVGGNKEGRSQLAMQQYEFTKAKAQRASIAESRGNPYTSNEFMKVRG